MLNEKPVVRHRIGSARISATGRIGSGTRRASSARSSSSDHHHSYRPRLYTGRPSSAPPVGVPRKRPSSAPPQGRVGGSSPDLYSIKNAGFLSSNVKFKSHDVSHLNLKVEGKSTLLVTTQSDGVERHFILYRGCSQAPFGYEIRSVAHVPRHHQPVNRGSLCVVSSHGYVTPRLQKPILSDYNARIAGSDSDRSTVIDFGKTYTLSGAHHPGNSSNEHQYSEGRASVLGSTYTKEEKLANLLEDGCENVFSRKQLSDGMNYGCSEMRTMVLSKDREVDECSESDSSTLQKYFNMQVSREGTDMDSDQREPNVSLKRQLSASKPRPYNCDIYGNPHQTRSSPHHFIRKDVDAISSDGSECTVISLGRKIQLMASSIHPNREQNSDREEKDVKWDSEWKELLKQNHELLLRLSTKENYSCESRPNSKCEHVKPIYFNDSSVQTNFNESHSNTLLKDVTVADYVLGKADIGFGSLEVRNDPSLKPSLRIDTDTKCEDEDKELSPKSDLSECILEDIIEESSQSSKSTPRDVKNSCDADNLDKDLFSKPTQDVNVNENSYVSNNSQGSLKNNELRGEYPAERKNISDVRDTVNEKEITINKKTPRGTYSGTDFSCTTDLPTYRLGLAAGFAVKSLFAQRSKCHSSKDLLKALQMIEDEEKKTQENREKETPLTSYPDHNFEPASSFTFLTSRSTNTEDNAMEVKTNSSPDTNAMSPVQNERSDTSSACRTSSSEAESDRECGATLPVIQVLVEKVFLFTQDLAERWQEGEFKEHREELLSQLVKAENLLEDICMKEGKKQDPQKSPTLHTMCDEKARRKQEEFESRIQKNLELIRKLLDDKKLLTEACEDLQKKMRTSEKKHTDKLKLVEDRQNQELKSLRERLTTAEQEKREKWLNQKTKAIKESTYRGLESKMKDLNAKHRDEISQLKAQQWEAIKEVEEKCMNQLRCQEEELKKKCEEEKENVSKKEREQAQQRLEIEIRQCEHHSVSRIESLRKHHEQELKSLADARHENEDRLRTDHEAVVKEMTRDRGQMIDQLREELKSQCRKHEEELVCIRREDERSRSEWREQFMREHNEVRVQAEKEMRERFKRQRDKEIERVIKTVKQETATREEEECRSYDAKIKNLRERYELELKEMETSEREARSRYLEMKSLLAQKEEEVVYLRARLHTQDMELCELQHMFQPPGD